MATTKRPAQRMLPVVDTRNALQAGVLDVPHWVRRLGQWGRAYQRNQVSSVRYRYELTQLEERFRAAAAACSDLADECSRTQLALYAHEGE